VGENSTSLGSKPTTTDVARVAGVSLATVDRVLNERPGVRAVTIDKVQDAIEQLGYIRDTAAANLARQRVYRLIFILPDTSNEFVVDLEGRIEEHRKKLLHQRTTLETIEVPPFDPRAVVAALDQLDADRVDGVAIFGPETPSVRDAVKRVRARGIAVVALVSDLPSSKRDHFVGIDNVAAGRTAAQLMGRFTRGAGRILVITLESSGLAQELVIVAHELTDSSRTALENGVFDAIISQDSGHLIRSATRLLKATADQVPIDHLQERIRIDIYLRENLPALAVNP